jgi:hypothetical protein
MLVNPKKTGRRAKLLSIDIESDEELTVSLTGKKELYEKIFNKSNNPKIDMAKANRTIRYT